MKGFIKMNLRIVEVLNIKTHTQSLDLLNKIVDSISLIAVCLHRSLSIVRDPHSWRGGLRSLTLSLELVEQVGCVTDLLVEP